MKIPSDQEAVRITGPGGPEVLQICRVPVPSPSSDQVLIRVVAAGVNRHDCNQRRRGQTPAHSDIPGLEVAGVVVATGSRFGHVQIGDRVCALVDGGGYAQYALAEAVHVLPVPGGISVSDAAALPEAGFTVWHNFFNVAKLEPRASVLLHGGTSGVGVLAIQLLSQLGHPVYVTCGSSEKMKVALELGARAAFDYTQDDFVKGILGETSSRGVDVILDMSGGRYSARNIEALAMRGAIVHLSPGDGAVFDAPLRSIMAKEARITGSMLRPLPNPEKGDIARHLARELWPLIERGLVRPVIHKVLPLAHAAEAHRVMESGAHIGKILLAVSEPSLA